MLAQSSYGAPLPVLKTSLRTFSHVTESGTFRAWKLSTARLLRWYFANPISVDAVDRFTHI